jgi:hypothetical protein
MSDVRHGVESSTPSQDREPYEAPCAQDLDVAAGTTEAASMVVVS